MAIAISEKPRTKRRRGRPTKLTKEVGSTIIRAVRSGVYLETAAQMAGIAPRTFFNWMAEGEREPDSRYGRFSAGVKKALALVERRLVRLIEDHSRTDRKGQWTAAAWILERRFPMRWSRRPFDPKGESEMPPKPQRTNAEIMAEINAVFDRLEVKEKVAEVSAGSSERQNGVAS